MSLRTWCSVAIVFLIAGAVLGDQLRPAPGALAQEDDQCVQMIADALAEAKESCADMESGQACYGSAIASALTDAPFEASGDTVDLASVDSLSTSAVDGWGVVVMQLPTNLPEGSPVMGVLFGEATAKQAVSGSEAASESTLTVTNNGTTDANLRGGAGVNFPVAGVLPIGQSATADGRNAQSDWIRIQTDSGLVWVFAELVTPEGDLAILPVLQPTDVSPLFQPSSPFQALILTTNSAAATCPSASSGLLLQYSGEQPTEIQVNGVIVSFSDATLLLTAVPNERLTVAALAGSGTVTAQGASEEVTAGSAVRVLMSGENSLTPAAPPAVAQPYAFAEAVNAPVSLLPGALPCVVGMASPDTRVVLRVGPGTQRGPLANMLPDKVYSVIGWANDGEGAPWWQLDTGEQKSWVSQAEVNAIGACDTVAEAEVPPLVFAAPAAPPAGEGGEAETVDDFAPAANSVWQMIVGADNMQGECSGTPAITFCDHLAAISPAQGGVMWKGMEASPYYLTRIQPNVYAYSGPNVLGTGTINMTLRFTSDSTVTMVQSLTLRSEPNCQHVYNYTGSKNW